MQIGHRRLISALQWKAKQQHIWELEATWEQIESGRRRRSGSGRRRRKVKLWEVYSLKEKSEKVTKKKKRKSQIMRGLLSLMGEEEGAEAAVKEVKKNPQIILTILRDLKKKSQIISKFSAPQWTLRLCSVLSMQSLQNWILMKNFIGKKLNSYEEFYWKKNCPTIDIRIMLTVVNAKLAGRDRNKRWRRTPWNQVQLP